MFRQITDFLLKSKKELLVLFVSLFNKDTPKAIKTFTIAAFLYLISPIDFIPDMIPGIGLLDDAILVPGILYTMIQILPPSVRAVSEKRADYWMPKLPYVLSLVFVLLVCWGIFVSVAIYNFIFS